MKYKIQSSWIQKVQEEIVTAQDFVEFNLQIKVVNLVIYVLMPLK